MLYTEIHSKKRRSKAILFFVRLKHYIFEPRLRISRFQLNLFAVFFLFTGSAVGIYFTSSQILKIFAANDQIFNWSFSNSTTGDYTTNLASVDDSGAHPSGGQTGANEFSNPGFETDLTGWSASPKTFDDASFAGASGAVAAWPLDDTNSTQSYARVVNPADSEGRNTSINGTFDSTTGWALNSAVGSSFSIASGKLVHSGVDYSSAYSSSGYVNFVPGKTYKCTFSVSDITSGAAPINFYSGGGSTNNFLFNGTFSNGLHERTFTAPSAANNTLNIFGSALTGGYKIDDIKIMQLNIPDSSSFTGTELLTDVGMEISNTNVWQIYVTGSVLSKETIDPHEGSRVLRITSNNISNAGALINSFFTLGKRYRITGYARTSSAGTGIPRVYIGGPAWVGAHSTNWQYFAFEGVPTTQNLTLYGGGLANGEYIEFDDVSIAEVDPLIGSNVNGVIPNVDSTGHLTKSYSFDGSNDVVNIYSSDLNSVFNPNEGTLVAWAKVANSNVWTDGTLRYVAGFISGSSDGIVITRWVTNNVIRFQLYGDNGTVVKQVDATGQTSTEFQQYIVTWNKSSNEFKAYLNGSQIGSTQTGLGTLNGNLLSNRAVIGAAYNTGASGVWNGQINDVRLYNRALSSTEIFNLYSGTSATHDTGTKYAGNASSKLVSYEGYNGTFVQSVNVGDAETYQLEAYAYTTGAAVTSSDLELYYNGAAITTAYTPTGIAGWYKLTGTVTGANEAREYGVLVKANKTVYVDNFTLFKQGEYSLFNKDGYFATQVYRWDSLCEGTFSGTTCVPDATYSGAATIRYQICDSDVGSADGTSHGTACQTGNLWEYWDGDSWESATNTTTHTNTITDLDSEAMNALSATSHKISVKSIFSFEGADVPILHNLSVGLTTDIEQPIVNASEIKLKRSITSTSFLNSASWTNGESPYFSWTGGQDDLNGSGVKGYCLYLGHDSSATPNQLGVSEENPNGTYLGTSPINTEGTSCRFIVPGTDVDFNSSTNLNYRGSTWLTTSDSLYYLKVWVIDYAGNVRTSDPASFAFYFDNTLPTNVSYISPASGNFSNVVDMNFSWPTSGNVTSSDSHSQVLGWQYQINGTEPTKWKGTSDNTTLGIRYIPTGTSSYTLTEEQDSYNYDSEGNPTTPIIVAGNNVVYFRTVDVAGNFSSDGTVRTGNLYFGGAAPTFGGTDVVTVTPNVSNINSFSLSWPAATATSGQSVSHYYYMLTPPPTTLATLQGNPSTYVDNGTALSVSARALPGVNKGANTVWVVAVDDISNYSPSNFISGVFELNSTNPDNVGNLSASDVSIKALSQWNVALAWAAPVYQGAGNLLYEIHRSTDGVNFSLVGSTMGLSYVDNTPDSTLYYYKIFSKDAANAISSGTNAVSITPTGKWSTPPGLESGPTITLSSTRKAVITWSTSRSADSKIAYGTKSGNYYSTEPSNSTHVTAHSIELAGLNPSTVYYYIAKWTDEDGNTGISEEKSFVTAPAPAIIDVQLKYVSLNSALIEFISKNSSKVKIYYGKTTSFGGVKEISTATSESTYLESLEDLEDDTKYFYKINTIDTEGYEYEGTVLTFTTLPRPQVSEIRIQQVANTAQSTVLVSWISNTEISSIVSFYPIGKEDQIQDEVNIDLIKGEHKMIVRSLSPNVEYTLIVKGRDRLGNEAISDPLKFTTATDTRSPQITELNVEGSMSTGESPTAQLIISWNTDELSTSQVEFGEGTGNTYSYKTQLDNNLTLNHLVIISSLTPSKVYHLRAVSMDDADNVSESYDVVTITPKATDSALNLIITNLQEVFSFL